MFLFFIRSKKCLLCPVACFTRLLRTLFFSLGKIEISELRTEEMNRLLFELLARWVAGLIPGVALLHIMCKTKKPSGDDRSAGGQSTRCAAIKRGLGMGYRAYINRPHTRKVSENCNGNMRWRYFNTACNMHSGSVCPHTWYDR